MIDLHSHIISGIDDGARSVQDSLDMARYACDIGITHMLCTPHFHQGVFDNTVNDVKRRALDLAFELKQQDIPLRIGISGEIRLRPEIITLYDRDQLPILGTFNDKKLMLLELPHSHIPPGVENLIKWLIQNDVIPVIPHPERNRDIMSDYGKLGFLKRLGCKFQVTAGAFVGRFSSTSTEVAHKMLKEDCIFYIASDTHNMKSRPNDMRVARDHISSIHSPERSEELTLLIPQKITKETIWL